MGSGTTSWHSPFGIFKGGQPRFRILYQKISMFGTGVFGVSMTRLAPG
jgi:hypothetical protein